MNEKYNPESLHRGLIETAVASVSDYLSRLRVAQSSLERLNSVPDPVTPDWYELAREELDYCDADEITFDTEGTPSGQELGSLEDRVRLHEAGHALLAHLLGVKVHTIETQGRSGLVKCGSLIEQITRYKNFKVIRHGGFAAEALMCGVYSPSDSELEQKIFDPDCFQIAYDLLHANQSQLEELVSFLEYYPDGIDAEILYGEGGPFNKQREI